MGDTMTLEQVRALLIEKTVRNRRGTIACPAWAKCVRDAIDAAICERDELTEAVMFGKLCADVGAGYMQRAEKAEAELAALKVRIEAAPLTTFRRAMLGTPHAWVEEKFACPEWIGKRVRLVVED